ncbi:MAG: 4Fe-4S binding protein [Deltaproteobacteria bacterium]|nr:4Fe-4S binding protein [Deltaproteobacteria bacterium]
MKIVNFLAEVDPSKCKGDKLCEAICPTGSIRVFEKKAQVEDGKCVACTRCVDRCPEDAITLVRRSEPMVVGTSSADIDGAEIRELCLKAHRKPDELICICTGTYAEEIAASIIKGARSVREIALTTGALTGCQEFCVPVVQRMLKAYGVDIAESGTPLTYDQSFSLWDIPEAVHKKYPEYYFKEDRELATKLRKG